MTVSPTANPGWLSTVLLELLLGGAEETHLEQRRDVPQPAIAHHRHDPDVLPVALLLDVRFGCVRSVKPEWLAVRACVRHWNRTLLQVRTMTHR